MGSDMTSKGEFVRVADSDEVCVGQAIVVSVDGRDLALVRLAEELVCIDNRCPHAGGRLGEGDVEGCRIRCPRHGWKFDLKSGKCTNDPRFEVQRFKVRTDKGGVYIEVPGSLIP